MIPFIVVIGIYAVISIILSISAFFAEMLFKPFIFAFTLIFVYFFIVMLIYRSKVINKNRQEPINNETLDTTAVG